MAVIYGKGQAVPGVAWTSMPITGGQGNQVIQSGNPASLFPQRAQGATANQNFEPQASAPPDIGYNDLPGKGAIDPNRYTTSMHVSKAQAERLLRTMETRTLFPARFPQQALVPGYRGQDPASIPVSGLSHGVNYMYGGPNSTGAFPWRNSNAVVPTAQVSPETRMPISRDQAQSLVDGGDPSNVLGQNALPTAPPTTPLPPSAGVDTIGPPTVTQDDQLSGVPWTSIELTKEEIPEFMGHVITDPDALALLQNLIPDATWQSDTMRPGTAPDPAVLPPPAPPTPDPVVNLWDQPHGIDPTTGQPLTLSPHPYLRSEEQPVPGFPWTSAGVESAQTLNDYLRRTYG